MHRNALVVRHLRSCLAMQGVQVQFLVSELRSYKSWCKSTGVAKLVSPRTTARKFMHCNERSGMPELRLNTAKKINKYFKNCNRKVDNTEDYGGGAEMLTFLLSVSNGYSCINLARLRYVPNRNNPKSLILQIINIYFFLTLSTWSLWISSERVWVMTPH